MQNSNSVESKTPAITKSETQQSMSLPTLPNDFDVHSCSTGV